MKNSFLVVLIIFIGLNFKLNAKGNLKPSFYFKKDGFNDKIFISNFGEKQIDYPYITENIYTDTYYLNAQLFLLDSLMTPKSFGNSNTLFAEMRFVGGVGKYFHVFASIVYDQNMIDNPAYNGKVWRKNLAAYTKSGFCEFKKDFFTFRFGNYPLDLGVSNFDNFLFSETEFGFNKAYINFGFKHISFDTFVGKVDTGERNISMHRLRFFPNRYFNINLVETVVYHGDARLDFINPFTVYHGIQMNKQEAANTLGTIEIESFVTKEMRLYSVFLLDDYQFDNKEIADLEPNEIGWMGGISILNLFTNNDIFEYEYSFVTNRTFNSANLGEKFMLGASSDIENGSGEYIGSKIGNDYDIHRLKYTLFFKRMKFSYYAHYKRKGKGAPENEFDTPWNNSTVEEGYNENFPTGKIVYTFKNLVEIDYEFADYFDTGVSFSYAHNQFESNAKYMLFAKINFDYTKK